MEAVARDLTFLTLEGAVRLPFFQREYVWAADSGAYVDECVAELVRWKSLIDHQPAFCAFAAKWPPEAPEARGAAISRGETPAGSSPR